MASKNPPGPVARKARSPSPPLRVAVASGSPGPHSMRAMTWARPSARHTVSVFAMPRERMSLDPHVEVPCAPGRSRAVKLTAETKSAQPTIGRAPRESRPRPMRPSPRYLPRHPRFRSGRHWGPRCPLRPGASSKFDIGGVEVVTDALASCAPRRHHRRARAEEWIQHQVTGEGVELNQPLGQLDGKGCRMLHPVGSLWGMSHTSSVSAMKCRRPECCFREATLPRDVPWGSWPDQSVPYWPRSPVRSYHAAQGWWVSGTIPRHMITRSLTLLPDDLASGQQPEVVLQNGHDIGRQAPIRLASEIGHVDRNPTPGSSTRLHSANTSRNSWRYSRYEPAPLRDQAPLHTACPRSREGR